MNRIDIKNHFGKSKVINLISLKITYLKKKKFLEMILIQVY